MLKLIFAFKVLIIKVLEVMVRGLTEVVRVFSARERKITPKPVGIVGDQDESRTKIIHNRIMYCK
jgi:hypothetical protein